MLISKGSDEWTIDVVVPTFNRSAELLRALESVNAQSVRPNRVIVVDDASTDDTDLILKRIPNVEVITCGVRGGAAAARNLGAGTCSASWIAFLDSDDEWHPSKLERQIDALKANLDSIAVGCNTTLAANKGRRMVGTKKIKTAELLQRNVAGSTSGMIVNTEMFKLVGGFDSSMPSCQDWELWLRLSRVGGISFVNDGLVIYHRDANNRISLNLKNVVEGHMRLLTRAIDWGREVGVPENIVKSAFYGIMSELYTRPFRRYDLAARYAIQALKNDVSISGFCRYVILLTRIIAYRFAPAFWRGPGV